MSFLFGFEEHLTCLQADRYKTSLFEEFDAHGVAAVRRHAGLLRQRQSDCAPLGVGGGARDAPSRRGLEDGRHVHDTAGGGAGGSAAGGGGRRAVAGRTDRQTALLQY